MALADKRLPSVGWPPALAERGHFEHRIIPALRRQAPWIAISALLVLGFSAVLTARQVPVYSASVSLRVEDRPRDGSGGMLPLMGSSPAIETEIEMLRSRSVALDVVRRLALNATVIVPPSVSRQDVFQSIAVDAHATRGNYRVSRLPSEVSLLAPNGTRIRGEYLESLSASGLTLSVARPRTGASDEVVIAVGDTLGPAETLRANLRVTRPQANANLVVATFEGTDAALTSEVANEIARSYLERRNAMQKRKAGATVQFLRTQEVGIGRQLESAESVLETFRRERLMVDPQAQSSEQMRRLADIRVRRVELEARGEALRTLLATASRPGDSTMWTAVAVNPAIASNAAISDLLLQLTRLETDRIQLSERRTADDPDMRSLQSTTDVLTRRLTALVQGQLRALDEELRGQRSVQGGLDSALLRIPAADLEYGRLRRNVDVLSQLHTLLQTRLKEAEIAEAVEAADIQVVDLAVMPMAPIRPRPRANLLFGLVAGLVLGLVVALMRELSDTVMRSRNDVRTLTDVRVLASIPHQSRGLRLRGDTDRGVQERLVTKYAPQSPAAEAFRALRTSITVPGGPTNGACRILVVTSAEPQTGKSTTAANLAVTLAEQGKRVLLLEADHRRPVLHRVFGVPRDPGLTDVLVARVSFEQAIHDIAVSGHGTGTLAFLAGGTRVSNPADILGSIAMRQLLELQSSRFDSIILDTPPMGLVTDAAVAIDVGSADGVILVARMGATHSESLRRAVEELQAMNAPLSGLVLTDVRRRDDHYGSYYGQYYGPEDVHAN